MIDFNKDPDFLTDGPNGPIKWFIDEDTTQYAKDKLNGNVSLKCDCFVTIHPDGCKERVIIKNDEIIYARTSSLEDIACFIDVLKRTTKFKRK
ncbi:MAG: hypothetical protein M0R17_00990 [Candidatus Omnitrophica bacterium]|jgi:hypothetical protein|nr:hypothetical protein [Candidatus Omnitrophota bacterium]